MGKRSDFKRITRDCYDTPIEAVAPLLPYLGGSTHFIEPAAGAGALVRHLEAAGHLCIYACDIEPRGVGIVRGDMLKFRMDPHTDGRCVITNPPWDRELLHGLILHLRELALPAWLLIDANWMFTQQAAPFLLHCAHIVTIGRIIWIPGTTMTGKDDCVWMQFMPWRVNQTQFHGKVPKMAGENTQALLGNERLRELSRA